MSDSDHDAPDGERQNAGVTEDDIVRDLRSTYADLRCPVHDVAPKFERDEKGGIVEALCCEVLGQIFRELRAKEGGSAAG